MLDNLLQVDEQTSGNGDVVLQKNANNIDGTHEQRGIFKENMNAKERHIFRVRNIAEMSAA